MFSDSYNYVYFSFKMPNSGTRYNIVKYQSSHCITHFRHLFVSVQSLRAKAQYTTGVPTAKISQSAQFISSYSHPGRIPPLYQIL